MHKNLLFICRRSRIVVCLLQKYFLRIKRSIIGWFDLINSLIVHAPCFSIITEHCHKHFLDLHTDIRILDRCRNFYTTKSISCHKVRR